MSKGSQTRPHNKERFDESFERVFGRKEIKTWNPDGKEESQDSPHTGNPDCRAGQDGSKESQDPDSRGSEG